MEENKEKSSSKYKRRCRRGVKKMQQEQQDVRVKALENISRRYNISMNNLGRTIITMLKEEAETNEKRRIAAMGILKYTQPPPLQPLVDQFYRGYMPRNLDPLKKTVTILIEMHGCDLPFPLFYNNPEGRKKISRIHMTSSVPHGCGLFKDLPVVLDTTDKVFRDENLSSKQQVDAFSQFMIDYGTRIMNLSTIVDPYLIEQKNIFIANSYNFFRDHPVIINREYSLDKNVAGIYIVHSNQPTLDIHFDYHRFVTEEIDKLSGRKTKRNESLAHLEKNNILSSHVWEGLRNPHDHLTHLIKTNNRFTLEDIINVLFTIDNWSDIHVIDLGCRQTCDYAYPPELKRMASQDIIDLEFTKRLYQTEEEIIEQERLERERLEQERLEQERLEQERLERERLERERKERERTVLGFQLINQYTGRWFRNKYNSKRRRVNKRRGTKHK